MALAKKGAKVGKVKLAGRKKPVRFLLSKHKPVYPKVYEKEYWRILKELIKDVRSSTYEVLDDIKHSLRMDSSEIRNDDTQRQRLINKYRSSMEAKKSKEKAKIKVGAIKQGVKNHQREETSLMFSECLGMDVFLTDGVKSEDICDEWEEMQYDLIDNMLNTYEDKLATEVSNGLMRGLTIGAVMAGITKLLRSTQKRAEFISHNEVTNLVANTAKANQETLGVAAYEWVTAHDEKVRPEHQARDGKLFYWNRHTDGMINGVPCYAAPDFHPGMDYNCRCVAKPVVDLESMDMTIGFRLGGFNIREDLEV